MCSLIRQGVVKELSEELAVGGVKNKNKTQNTSESTLKNRRCERLALRFIPWHHEWRVTLMSWPHVVPNQVRHDHILRNSTGPQKQSGLREILHKAAAVSPIQRMYGRFLNQSFASSWTPLDVYPTYLRVVPCEAAVHVLQSDVNYFGRQLREEVPGGSIRCWQLHGTDLYRSKCPSSPTWPS